MSPIKLSFTSLLVISMIVAFVSGAPLLPKKVSELKRSIADLLNHLTTYQDCEHLQSLLKQLGTRKNLKILTPDIKEKCEDLAKAQKSYEAIKNDIAEFTPAVDGIIHLAKTFDVIEEFKDDEELRAVEELLSHDEAITHVKDRLKALARYLNKQFPTSEETKNELRELNEKILSTLQKSVLTPEELDELEKQIEEMEDLLENSWHDDVTSGIFLVYEGTLNAAKQLANKPEPEPEPEPQPEPEPESIVEAPPAPAVTMIHPWNYKETQKSKVKSKLEVYG